MFCPKCGTQLPDGARFCGGCGMQLGRAANGSGAVAGAAVPSGQATQAYGQQGTAQSPAHAVRTTSLAPTLVCAACGLLFVAAIVVLAQGFAREVQLLISSLSMYDEGIVTIAPIAFAACLLVPAALCLFGFENCAERLIRRYAKNEKIGRTVVQGILAAALLAVFAALPLFTDLITQLQGDRVVMMAVEAGIESLAHVALVGVWLPVVAVVLLFVLKGMLPAGGEQGRV